jgi:glycosyltransferase involved in cell wall biosynthesis
MAEVTESSTNESRAEDGARDDAVAVETPRISLIIPARNEADCLPDVLRELPFDMIHEVIVVDGYSTDGTVDVVNALALPKVKVIAQMGRGFGMAILTGIRRSEGDLITIFDADGSFNPAALPLLLQRINDGYDMVYCSRYMPDSGSDDDTFIRLVGNTIFTFLLRLMFRVQLSDALFYFCMGKKEVYEYIDPRSADFSLCIEVPVKVHRMGFRYTEVPMRERPRAAGESKVNAIWDGIRILKTMIKLKLSGI